MTPSLQGHISKAGWFHPGNIALPTLEQIWEQQSSFASSLLGSEIRK